MATNRGLNKAGQAKRDEFYTLFEDVEAEMAHYPGVFAGKTVFCNCDDPFTSNFFKYFVLHFNELGLRKLISTCYVAASAVDEGMCCKVAPRDVRGNRLPYKATITRVDDALILTGCVDADALFDLEGNRLQVLVGDGDFRSRECIGALVESDIVVTNPPFSLFREFISLLEQNNKQFIIMGNVNALTYKEVFPLFKNDRLWLGASIHSGDRKFYVPDDYPLDAAGCGIDENGRRFVRVKGVRWFTNVDYEQRHETLTLEKAFDDTSYSKFDNYNAINVSRTMDIPFDYEGVMGVPITFLDRYSPDQFQILMLANGNARTNTAPDVLRLVGYERHKNDKGGVGLVNDKRSYARVLIRKRLLESA